MNKKSLQFEFALTIILCLAFSPLRAEKSSTAAFCFINFYTGIEFYAPINEIKTAQNNFILQSEAATKNQESGYECKTPYDAFGMCSIKSVEGLHAAFQGIDVTFYKKLPSTQLSVFSTSYSEEGLSSVCKTFCKESNDGNSGFSIKMNELTPELPLLSLYCGELSFSKSVSLLKNPSFSSMSDAIKNSMGRQSGISPTIPTASSANKPYATAITFKPSIFTFECACFDDSNFLFSAGSDLLYKNFMRGSIAVSGGRFFLEETSDSSWFCDERHFASDWYDAYVLEITVSIPRIKNQMSVGCHKNPFGNFRFWFKNENRMTLSSFLIDTAFFATDNYLFSDEKEGIRCADNSILKTVAQAKINPQFRYTFPSNKIKIHTGITGAAQIKRQDVWNAGQYTELLGGTAAEISSKKAFGEAAFEVEGITYKSKNISNPPKPKYTLNFKSSYAFSQWKAVAKTTIVYSETDDDSMNSSKTYAIAAYFPKQFCSAISIKTTKTQNKTSDLQQTEAAVNLTHSTGKLRFKGKIAIKIQW